MRPALLAVEPVEPRGALGERGDRREHRVHVTFPALDHLERGRVLAGDRRAALQPELAASPRPAAASRPTGERFPTSVTVAPRRTQSIAVFTVARDPHRLERHVGAAALGRGRHLAAPRPPPAGRERRAAPSRRASSRFSGSRSIANTRAQPAARSTCTRHRPIMPAPTTTAVSPTSSGVRPTACAATATGSTIAACSKLMPSGTR